MTVHTGCRAERIKGLADLDTGDKRSVRQAVCCRQHGSDDRQGDREGAVEHHGGDDLNVACICNVAW